MCVELIAQCANSTMTCLDRLVVRALLFGSNNPGSNPGLDTFFVEHTVQNISSKYYGRVFSIILVAIHMHVPCSVSEISTVQIV